MMQRDLDTEKKIMLKAYIGAAGGCLELMEELADKAPSRACGYAYMMKTVMDRIIDDMVYIIDVANRREPRSEHCRLWLSRAEFLDLYGQLADALDAEEKE